MNISELSIRRPVLATVLTIIILLFGFIGYSYLGVREYPSVDNPIISVSCSYPGANADVIENQITEPLEQNINGIPGIRSLSSVSQQGQSRITVEFELSVDLETAANDVRDKVSRAQRYLPRDCDPPTVSKADADAMPILMVALQSDKRSLLELSEIADLTVKEQLQTISDVSSVSIWGEKRYSMRLWLDPVKMAGYGISPIDNSVINNVSTLKTTILQIRDVAEEDTVGYSRKGHLVRPSRIAAIPIGYADGLNRHLGCGHGYCLVNGKKAPYVGNICMDVCMIDVTDIDCREGDQAVIFGDELPITVLSDTLDTIPYEVLTGISTRVKRVYYQD